MKKRILSILLVVSMLAVMIPAFAVASSAETTVADWNADVITLMNVDDFLAFRAQIVAGKTFAGQTVELGADLDLTGVTEAGGKDPNSMNAIGDGDYFCGTFDGKFHTISNMKVAGYGYQGAMFGAIPVEVKTTATIKNLSLVNASTWGSSRNSLFYAAAYSSVSFENVYVSASVKGSGAKDFASAYIGHIAGAGCEFSFTNCVFEGTITNNGGTGAFAGQIINSDDAKYFGVKSVSFTNCINVSSSAMLGANNYPSTPVNYTNCVQSYSEETMGAGFTATTPDGFTALNTGYPVPTTLLPFFADKVNETTAAEGVTTKYYGYQDNGSMTALRLIGLVNGEKDAFTSVGFEIAAVGPKGAVANFTDDVTSVYTSVETPSGEKAAAELGGNYIFVTEIGGIVPNSGVATFAVKTYSVDAQGVKTYTDMYVVSFDTTVAAQ